MTSPFTFVPTAQQAKIIGHEGSAFIEACPGAGKTRVMVERARRLCASNALTFGQGVAFLSFTRAAVSELAARLEAEGVIGHPTYPHFIGTFDSFVWQFFIAPFGIPGVAALPRLLPDKEKLLISPKIGLRSLALECFDRDTGYAIEGKLAEAGFKGYVKGYETTARKIRERFLAKAELDYEDARRFAVMRLRQSDGATALIEALRARFVEIIIDEAQDCNPVDLEIAAWLRAGGLPTKVICDPNQAIYGFRGGVGEELRAFAGTFPPQSRLPVSGNFRSGRNIAKAISAMREPEVRGEVDDALGDHRDEPTPVHLLAFKGHSAPASVGREFEALTASLSLVPEECPVVGSTLNSARRACGQPADEPAGALSYRLAVCVETYHRAVDMRIKLDALEGFYRITMELSGALDGVTFHQHLIELGTEVDQWRPSAIALLHALEFQEERHTSAEKWLCEAREILKPLLPIGSSSISQKLQNRKELSSVFSEGEASKHPPRTIHSVKGMEFDAVCVVLATKTAKGIVDRLIGAGDARSSESARKLYVGASRARRLLAIAVPDSQAKRLYALLSATGASVLLSEV